MVYYTDGREPPVYNTPAGPMSPLSHTPGAGQNPTYPADWNIGNGAVGGAIVGGITGALGGGVIGGLAGAPAGPIGFVGGALMGAGIGGIKGFVGGMGIGFGLDGLNQDPKDPGAPWGASGNPFVQTPQGYRLVIIKDGQIVAGWNNATGYIPGSRKAKSGTREFTVYWIDVFINGQYSGRYNYTDDRYPMFVRTGFPDIIPGRNPANGYQPGRTLDPNNPDNDGLPDNPFSNPDFLPALRDALGDLLGDLLSGGGGTPGGPGGEEGEEGEEDEGDDDESCSGKHPLRILKTTVDKVYTLLGGDLFGGDKCNSRDSKFRINPEQFLRNVAGDCYSVQPKETGAVIIPGESEVTNYPELIAALLSVAYMRGGLYKFPSQTQDSIVKGQDNFLEGALAGIFGQPQRTFHDMLDVHQWDIEQLDALFGAWGQEIVIQDAQPLEPGEQPKKLFLPNLAEAISELYCLLWENKIHTDTMLNIGVHLGIELASTKAEVWKTELLADCILDTLAPKTKDVQKKVPIMFTLLGNERQGPDSNITQEDRESLIRFLQPSEKTIVVPELDGHTSIQSHMLELRKAAAVIMAVHTTKFKPGSPDSLKALKEAFRRAVLLTDLEDLSDVDSLIRNPRPDNEANGREEDFDVWLEKVEQGFTGEPGVGQADKPYDKEFKRRPKIRRAGQRRSDEPIGG